MLNELLFQLVNGFSTHLLDAEELKWNLGNMLLKKGIFSEGMFLIFFVWIIV